MYEIIGSVIAAGGYRLTEIRRKIMKLYIWGDLTEAQADELLALAAGGISAEAERPEVMQMLRTLAGQLEALSARLQSMEGIGDAEQTGYPAWKAWDGICADYQPDAVVSHGGRVWKSVYAGQNVWEPGTPGTEQLWEEVKEE